MAGSNNNNNNYDSELCVAHPFVGSILFSLRCKCVCGCVCCGCFVCAGVCVFASHFLMQKSDFSAQIFSKIKIFMLPTCLMPRAAAATDNAPRAMLRRCRRSWQTRASGSPHPTVHPPHPLALCLAPL